MSEASKQHQQLGNSAVGVQNTGNDNTFNISIHGVEPLHVVPWAVRCTFNKKQAEDVELLQPYRRAIEMVGRDADLGKLRDWLGSEPPISVRTLIASGGAGKTRMAIELLHGLDGQESQWIGGFLERQELTRFLGQQPLGTWRWRENCLIVVDYAATLAGELRDLLRGLTGNRASDQGKLRILLLERDADLNRGWLQFVQESGDSQPVCDLFHPRTPEPLSPISSIDDRRTILQTMLAALAQCAAAAGKQVTIPQFPTADAAINRQLADGKWSDPLYLMMAAVLALDGDIVRVLALPRRAIAEGTVKHETERLKKFGHGEQSLEDQILHLAAVSTLRGGLLARQVNPTIEAECKALGMALPQGTRFAAKILRNALPWRKEGNEGIAPILPDLLGEIFLLKRISALGFGEQTDVILRAAQEDPLETAAVLLRLCHDYAENGQSPAIGWLDTYIDYARNNKTELFLALWRKMPDNTVVLRRQAFLVVEECLKLDAAKTDTMRAIMLIEKAVRLSELGQREAALTPAQEAVKLYRKLAEANPDAFLPDLAGSLNNLANILSELGQREAALTPAQEAMKLYRKLAEANPDAFLPNLAASLNNLANILSELGQREAALTPAQEAVNIRRKLAEANPDAFLPDLAMSLNNLANRLSELGQREAALTPAQEAVKLYRKLAEANPDAFLPDLAGSLNNLANILSELGQREAALTPAQEALNIRRKLAEANPEAL